jgi:hypothetical protein
MDRRSPLSRRALGPIALIVALLLLVGAAVVFFVLAVGMVRDTLGGTGDLAEQVDHDLRPDERSADIPADADPDERPAGVPADAIAAIVERIVDGDTLRVIAPPGGADSTLPDGGSVRVRLLNLDAPELARDGQPAGCLAEEATDWGPWSLPATSSGSPRTRRTPTGSTGCCVASGPPTGSS